jgi:hypothetical protein
MKMHSLLALLFLIPQAHATSFFIRPFSEFTKTTNVIVRGVTTGIHAENVANSNGEKMIYTFANLAIKDVIKGSITGSSIRIRRPGGTLDEMTLEIPSSVEFKEGEEGVFFLSDEQDDHSYEVTGMELGKFNIVNQGGTEILKGGIFAYSKPEKHDSHGGHTFQSGDISENLKPWSITQLKELVQSQGSAPSASATTSESKTNLIPAPSSVTPESEPNQSSTQPPSSALLNDNDDATQQYSLYITPAFWYALALSILALGIYLIKRRG